jgi:hypothetical protein
MTDQDPELRALMLIARDGMSPTADDAERLRARLASALPLSAEPARQPVAGPGVRALLPTRLRWLAVGLSVGGLAGYALGQRPALHDGVASLSAPVQIQEPAGAPVVPEPPPKLPPAPRPAAAEPPSSETVPRVSSAAGPLDGDAGRPTKASRRAEPVESEAPDEVALMQRVNRALARGEAAWALALLRQLELEVPKGRLLEERAAGGAIARCLLDPRVGATELARYTQQYPSSVHLARVSQVCTAPRPG